MFIFKIKVNIIFAVDAPKVLSWILSDDINTKFVFIENRLKDDKHNIKKLKDSGNSISLNMHLW